MKKEDKKTGLAKLAERLYDPLQFRIFITVVMLAIGYMGIYTPLGDHITEVTKNVTIAREHEQLGKQIEGLRNEVNRIQERLPKNTDTNEWVQYVLAGIRKMPVTLVNLDSDVPRRVGPYDAIVLRVELRGAYNGLESFLSWIDTNQRLFRVDSLVIGQARGTEELEMRVTLLGLRG
ncbi:MAG: type 4a pilus biogenesis protein PilO [Pirellulales bacterium]|nr:type 4a pilus biogenesis protein PilO [Pirellulales bacterium]